MNILYIGYFSFPDKNPAALRVLGNALALRECDYNVIFIDEQSTSLPLHKICGFDVWSAGRPKNLKEKLKKLTDFSNVCDIIKYYDNKIDIIIAYNYPSIPLYKISKYCKSKGITLVSDCTEWYSGYEYTGINRYLCKMDTCYRMRIVNKKINGLIVASTLLSKYYHDCNTLLIPWVVDALDTKWCPTKIINDKNKLNIVFSASSIRGKENIDIVISSIANSYNADRIRLVIVGLTMQDVININISLKDIIQNSKSEIVFSGKVTHTDNLRIIASSDLFVFYRHNSRKNNAGFPTKFVEAITLGVPVLTTPTSDIKSYIDRNPRLGVIINNESELRTMLNLNFTQLLSMKSKIMPVDKATFDYHGKISDIKNWVSSLNAN